MAEASQHEPTTAAVVAIVVGDRLRIAEAELRRRESLYSAGHDVPNPNATAYAVWRNLARAIREQADILDILATAGVALVRADANEWSGPCPECGGNDRFRVWPAGGGEPGRFWCRQCRIRGDAISAYRDFTMPGSSFFAAVRVLAAQLGLRTPDHGVVRSRGATRPGRRIIPLRREVRRAG